MQLGITPVLMKRRWSTAREFQLERQRPGVAFPASYCGSSPQTRYLNQKITDQGVSSIAGEGTGLEVSRNTDGDMSSGGSRTDPNSKGHLADQVGRVRRPNVSLVCMALGIPRTSFPRPRRDARTRSH